MVHLRGKKAFSQGMVCSERQRGPGEQNTRWQGRESRGANSAGSFFGRKPQLEMSPSVNDTVLVTHHCLPELSHHGSCLLGNLGNSGHRGNIWESKTLPKNPNTTNIHVVELLGISV